MLKRMKLNHWLQLLTLGVGSFAIFYVLFCRASFYDAFVQAMDVTNTQFGVLYAIYGWIATFGYLVGGIVADRVAPRYLMFVSFLGTGICNFILGFWPSYSVLVVLYAVMGVTTSVTFWAAMLKCNRLLGRSLDAEGTVYSWLQTTRGLAELGVATLVVFLFTKFINIVAGLRFVVWTYAGLLVAFAIISLFVFDDGKSSEGEKEEDHVLTKESTFEQTVRLLKNPDIWLCILIAFGGYNIGSIVGSYLGSMAGTFGVAASGMAVVGLMVDWFKPIGSYGGGFIVKKRGSTYVLFLCTVLYMFIAAAFLLMPKESGYLKLFLIIAGLEIILTGAFRSQKFIQIAEAGIPVEDTGNAFGIISTIIYAGDATSPVIIGVWLDKYGHVAAYNRVYASFFALGLITIVALVIFRRRNKERIRTMIAEEKFG
ncbi:MAG TPA: MFS transporter [Mogibacterium sp.]|nr:MFS transporter [Mogibacterium sp.]